jgi:hypothetical protein
MIVLNGLVPDKDIEIKFTGLTDAHRAELQQLAALPDMTPMLVKIKEFIPAYTGWPRKKAHGHHHEHKADAAE